MRHRHLGPKVKYITRRNNIRYRQRPTHSQSLIRKRNRQFRKPVRRMSWDDDMPVGDEPSVYGDEYIRVKGNRTGPITIGEIERGDALEISEITGIDPSSETLEGELDKISFIEEITPEEKEEEFEEAEEIRSKEEKELLNELEDSKLRLDNLRNEFDEIVMEEISPENEYKKEFLMQEMNKISIKIKDLEDR